MSALTHTIGGVSFGALSSAAGRKSLGCFPEALEYDVKRFHAPGTAGNFIVRGDRMGGKIVAGLRYVDSLANVQSNYQSDRSGWENTALAIVDSTGTTFARCNLDNGGMKITRKPTSIGRGGLVFMDAVATFTVDS